MSIVDASTVYRQSRLGRFSFFVGLALPLGFALLLLCLYATNKLTFDHELKNALAGLIILYFFLLAPLMHFLGLSIGIIALFRRGTRRSFAVFGILFNLAVPAAGAAIWLFLIALKASAVVR